MHVCTPGGLTQKLPVIIGVSQSSALSPFIFNLIMDHVRAKVQDKPPWNILDFDNTVLINEGLACLEKKLYTWNEILTNNGIRINVKKIEYLHLPFGE